MEQPLIGVHRQLRQTERDWGVGLQLSKCLIVKWQEAAKSHCAIDHSDSRWRSAINRMELFCRNCSYRYRFNCIITVYMGMNCAGIVFGNRCTYLQSFVSWGFRSSFMLLYRLVCETELYFEKASGTEKIYCNNSGFYFVVSPIKLILFPNTANKCVRKQ